MRIHGAFVLGLLVACGGSVGNGNGDGDGGGDPNPGADGRPGGDAAACEAPDMLIVLDRTMSMHRRPDGTVPADTPAGHMESKWFLAIESLEAVTRELQGSIRFGLSLFPRDPGMDACVTLSQRITGTTATNDQCEAAEVAVPPGAQTAVAIDDALDPEATRLCRSTPIGAGLSTAIEELARVQNPIRSQYAVLLTDGQDTCDEPLVLANVQALAAAGIGTYAIGFDGTGGTGVDNGLLNDAACAGRTAAGFPAPCTDDGAGNFTATDRNGPPLYYLAEDAAGLVSAMREVAGEVCCGCVE